jgi:catechol 2,3-dioxygenase-like lactoylglutathione lyase family enzyme
VLPIPAFAGRPVFQFAFVVEDFEAALERYSNTLNTGPWRCWRFGAELHEACEYRGGPTEFTSLLALNDQSPQIELIQPLSGPSVHKDWLDAHGPGAHHLGIVVASVAEAAAQMADAGFPALQSGSGFGPDGSGTYAYFDTAAALGLMVEAVEPPTSMPPVDFVWPRERQASDYG